MEFTYPMALTVVGTVISGTLGVIKLYPKGATVDLSPFHAQVNSLREAISEFRSEIKDSLHSLENRLGQAEKEVSFRAEILKEIQGQLREIMTGGE